MLRRILTTLLALAVALPFGAAVARADHCEPKPAPPPIDNDYWWCHTPAPTPKPTPKPSQGPPAPTPRPATPRPATPRPAAATPRPTFAVTPSSPTPEVIDLGEDGPEIVVPGPVIDDTDDGQALDDAENTSGGGSLWLVTLVIGLVVGGLVGRASWGLSKRRRQQIFG